MKILETAKKCLKYMGDFANRSLKNISGFAKRSMKYIRDFPNRSLKYIHDHVNRLRKYILGLVAEGTQLRTIFRVICFPVILFLLLIIALFLPDWGNSPNDQSVLYLLSAISQSLAAAFALTFTVTIFCMQISAKYGQKAMSKFFTHDVLAYMVFFVSCIMLPLFLMNCTISYLVNLALLLSLVAFLSLIPYFFSFKKKLAIQEILKELFGDIQREVENRFRTGNYDSGIIELDTFYEIVMKTYDNRDFEGYRFGIDKIIKTGIEIEKIYATYKGSPPPTEMISLAVLNASKPFYTIQDIIKEVLNNYRSIQIIVRRLHENGTDSAKEKLGISTRFILECLNSSFDRVISAETNRWTGNGTNLSSSSELAQECLYYMQSISGICTWNELHDSVNFTAYKLYEKALFVMDINRDEYDRLILVSVGQVGTLSWSTIVAGKIDITESIMKRLWILGAVFFSRDLSHFVTVANEIKDFKRFYTDVLIGNISADNVNRTYASSHYRSRLHDFFRLGIDLGLIDRSLYSREMLSKILEDSYQNAINDYDEVLKYFEGAAQYVGLLNAFKEAAGLSR